LRKSISQDIYSVRQKYVHKQSKMESQRNVTYSKNKKNAIDINITQKKRNRHQHNTDDGGQAMDEEMRRVQMSR